MKKQITVFLLIALISLCFTVNALAESPEASLSDEGRTAMIIIAAVLATAAVISVLLVNRRTKKYRQMLKKKKKK